MEYSEIEWINRAAQEAKARGDYDEYWRLRQQYLNEQARIYQQKHQARERRDRR